MASNVAYRYAKAWMQQVLDDQLLDQTLQDVSGIRQTIKDSRELQLFLRSPMISRTSKKEALEKIFKGNVSDSSYKFIQLLLSKHREGFLGDVVAEFQQMYRDAAGIMDVDIRSAYPLSDETVKHLAGTLSGLTGKKVDPTLIVDENLIGGIAVRLGDQVIDGTVKHQLEKLEEQFSE